MVQLLSSALCNLQIHFGKEEEFLQILDMKMYVIEIFRSYENVS